MAKDITETLRRIQGDAHYAAATTHAARALPPVPPKAPIPERTGDSESNKSGPVASDFVESNYSLREYYAAGYHSSDGLFFMPAIKKVVMDGVTLQFAEPT